MTSMESIHRTLHSYKPVLIYGVPPLAPNSKGYNSAQWLRSPPMFTANLEIVETSTPVSSSEDRINVEINLLDPSNRDLFAAAPYNHPSVLTPCADSGRYFALRVADDSGRKATLGIGLESREDAFEFIAVLEQVRKTLGFETPAQGGSKVTKIDEDHQRVWKVKDGETMSVNVHALGLGSQRQQAQETPADHGLFAIKPPPAVPAADRTIDGNDDFGDFQ